MRVGKKKKEGGNGCCQSLAEACWGRFFVFFPLRGGGLGRGPRWEVKGGRFQTFAGGGLVKGKLAHRALKGEIRAGVQRPAVRSATQKGGDGGGRSRRGGDRRGKAKKKTAQKKPLGGDRPSVGGRVTSGHRIEAKGFPHGYRAGEQQTCRPGRSRKSLESEANYSGPKTLLQGGLRGGKCAQEGGAVPAVVAGVEAGIRWASRRTGGPGFSK